jgi:hypothetical protein
MPCLLLMDGKSSGHFNSLNNQKDCTIVLSEFFYFMYCLEYWLILLW